MKKRSISLDKHIITLTHEDKILFPQSDITKGELINYYQRISPFLLPFTQDRPLMLRRFPHGITQKGFFQKNIGDYFPKWIEHITISKKTNGNTTYAIGNSGATFVYLANQLAIEFHLWLSTIKQLNNPDIIIFDLDPSGKATFKQICFVAIQLKNILDDLQLSSYVKTTGSRGLHILIPIKPTNNFDIVRNYTYNIARLLVKQYPSETTLEIHKEKRGNKIFIDTLRNAYAQTAVAPYSIRAKSGAPVATPIHWKELITGNIKSSQQYTIKNIFRRIAHIKNPWSTIKENRQELSVAIKKLQQK